MRRVGITGHQGLTRPIEQFVRDRIAEELAKRGPVCGVSSLADGADQVFAEEVLSHGGSIVAVIPCAEYGTAFATADGRARYRELIGKATEVVELDFDAPGEAAYWAAGQRVVDLSDEMLAVWDGQQAGGRGGTADVVAYARQHDVPVAVLWPPGSSRG